MPKTMTAEKRRELIQDSREAIATARAYLADAEKALCGTDLAPNVAKAFTHALNAQAEVGFAFRKLGIVYDADYNAEFNSKGYLELTGK